MRQGFRAPARFKDDPRSGYAFERELDLVSWYLTAMFLREVMEMEVERIGAIRNLGDGLSSYVSRTNDRRFFRDFYMVDRYGQLRGLLIKASNAEVRRGRPPLIGFDEFITIFEEGEELPSIDWRLARDLVLIRMIEQLHHEGKMIKEMVPEEEMAPGGQAVES